MLTLQVLTYIEGNDQTRGPIWNFVAGKESGVTTQGGKVVGTLLLGNDKNSVIVNYLLSYLLCLSLQD